MGQRDAVTDGFRTRAPVADDGDTGQSEERRAAILGIIDPPAKLLGEKIGKHFDEPTIYKAAFAFEQAGDWKKM